MHSIRMEGGLINGQIFLSAADQTIIVSSYGKIGSDLKALNKTSWIATGYAGPSARTDYSDLELLQLFSHFDLLPTPIWKA